MRLIRMNLWNGLVYSIFDPVKRVLHDRISTQVESRVWDEVYIRVSTRGLYSSVVNDLKNSL